MKVDLFTSTGTKKGALELPSFMFEATIREGLMHQMMVLQQSNRRQSPAHVKTRGEKAGSTRKIFAQKGTGRARMGAVRNPIRRGGGKTFGPRNNRNFQKSMPQKQRHLALFSCLSLKAQQGSIIGLEGYDGEGKTKEFISLYKKLPLEHGRKILFVLPKKMEMLERSSDNVRGVKTILASYLNPEDVLGAYNIIFVGDSVKKAEEVFGKEKSEKVTKDTKAAKDKKSAAPSDTSTASNSS